MRVSGWWPVSRARSVGVVVVPGSAVVDIVGVAVAGADVGSGSAAKAGAGSWSSTRMNSGDARYQVTRREDDDQRHAREPGSGGVTARRSEPAPPVRHPGDRDDDDDPEDREWKAKRIQVLRDESLDVTDPLHGGRVAGNRDEWMTVDRADGHWRTGDDEAPGAACIAEDRSWPAGLRTPSRGSRSARGATRVIGLPSR